MSGPVKGGLFRRNYMQEAAPVADSQRARRRVALLANRIPQLRARRLADIVEMELGIIFPRNRYDRTPRFEKFCAEAELGDFLSAITIFYQEDNQLLDEFRRVFKEEDIRFQIDDRGGVHYLVDEEFERSISSTIAGLGAERFSAARTAVEEATEVLNAPNPSGKALIRGMFEAVETAFLVATGDRGNANRLNGQSLDTQLKPALLEKYDGQAGVEDKVDRLIEIFKKWVHAAHPYRHGAAQEEIHEAPLEVAILMTTQGLALLRYMVTELD